MPHKKHTRSKHKATLYPLLARGFTMIEIVFIIVIVGILSSVAMSRYHSDGLNDGAYMLARDLEYARHLAIIYDSRHLSGIPMMRLSDDDYKHQYLNLAHQFWGMKFYDHYKDGASTIKNPIYIIYKNTPNGKPTRATTAIDYMDKSNILGIDANKKLYNSNLKTAPRLDIRKSYGISRVEFLGSCAGTKHVFFDNEGVPYANATSRKLSRMDSPCIIRLSNSNASKCIIVYHQSGYIAIKDELPLNALPNAPTATCANYPSAP